jgi:GTP-binding protein Era
VKRCGNIALVGRPNVGKSTLLNRACGSHLSIVSPRPQTTRVQVRGILTTPEAQLVFLDTPGFNQRAKALSRAMLRRITDALVSADLVLLMTDVFPALRRSVEEKGTEGAFVHDVDRKVVARIAENTNRPVMLAVNKIDTLPNRNLALPVIEAYARLASFEAIVPISARTGLNVDDLVASMGQRLPEGEPLFPDDELTDRPARFFVAEIVRETAFHLLHEEIPYAVAVSIEHWIEEEGRLRIEARLIVEEPSQKKIVVGKGGSMVKRIGTEARKRIQEFLGRRLHLGLQVTVRRSWSDDPSTLERLIETP